MRYRQSQIVADSTPPYDPAVAAAAQLIVHGERHGSDSVPPADVLASWLEENRERFVKAWRASQKRKNSPSVSVQEDGSPSCLPIPGRGGYTPKRNSIADIYRRIRRCRRRVCGVRKRICDLLTRVGAAVYPADEAEAMQLHAFEKEVASENPPPAQLPGGNDVRTPSPCPDNGETAEQDAASSDDGTVDLREPRKFPGIHPRARQLRDAEGDGVDEAHPRRATMSRDKVPLPAQSQREAAPSPPEPPRRFHINQVAHLRPSYIAAQRASLAPRGQRPRWSSFGDQSYFYNNNNNNNSDGNNDSQVTKYNGEGYPLTSTKGFRDINQKAGGRLNSNAVARLRRGERLSGEVWIGGLGEHPSQRMGVLFVAKSLEDRVGAWDKGRGAGRVSKVGNGKGKGKSYV
ncbi:hypothetical protein GGS26DRAFT_590109 [Hypomontagnella submonticulosa]|nr:hypothetical protein GGS26DRAFT_590109 [Hypomontagnella submonticulosa]